MEENKKTLTIIDTFGFLFRSFYALPQTLKAPDGFPTNMLTGFMNFISSLGKDFKTDYIIFALDSKGDTFRHEIYKEYKSHRKEVPDDLKAQLPIAINFISDMGFSTASYIGLEADDIIASLATDGVKNGLNIRIVSHDKDLYQLMDENISMFDPIKRKKITTEDCFDKYGVYPSQFISYQSLLGDSADNIPGVKGVGAKTAMSLIQQFDNLENIYKNVENIEKPRWQKLLKEGQELAYISKQLVTLDKEAYKLSDIGSLDILNLPIENPILKIAKQLKRYGMTKIIERVHREGLHYKTNIPENYIQEQYTNKEIREKEILKCDYILLNNSKELFKIINSIPKNSIVALDTETTSIDSLTASIVGFSFCFENSKAYYIPISHFYLGVLEQISKEDAKLALEMLNKHKLILQNYKYDKVIISNNFNLDIKLEADTMILAWLQDSDKPVGIDKLVDRLFDGYKPIQFKDIVKKGEDFSNVTIEEACKYASEDAYLTFKSYFKLLEIFEDKDEKYMLQIAKQIEFPFISVLERMESKGIKIDLKFFEKLKKISEDNINEIKNKIYELSQEEFNINSPKQLGVVLFERLGLKSTKKTKTGYSTNESALLSIKDTHNIIPIILEYREAFKLHSTYIEPLLKLGKESSENKIHTSFIQTGTATGRLSSKNPNLQNIPVRTKAGRYIREGFIASDGYKLVGIDYSQIELRLLAHYSKDPALLEAFIENKDIHLETAIKIFGEDEAKSKRD
ncbi:MAG: DNA polymerase I, partial [Campylobacterota bacterium]|nr:DNA polymerase I [Campylobacterota bacterium]